MNSNDSAQREADAEEQQRPDDEVIDNGIVFIKGKKMVYYRDWEEEEDDGGDQRDVPDAGSRGGVIVEERAGTDHNMLRHLDFSSIINDPSEVQYVSHVSSDGFVRIFIGDVFRRRCMSRPSFCFRSARTCGEWPTRRRSTKHRTSIT